MSYHADRHGATEHLVQLHYIPVGGYGYVERLGELGLLEVGNTVYGIAGYYILVDEAFHEAL